MTRTEVATADVAVVFARHRSESAQECRRRDESLLTGRSLRDLARGDAKDDRRRLWEIRTSVFLVFPAFFFGLAGLASLIAAVSLWGTDAMTRAAAAGLCLGGLAYLAFQTILLPIAIRAQLANENETGMTRTA